MFAYKLCFCAFVGVHFYHVLASILERPQQQVCRFWGHFRIHLGVILRTFSQMLQNSTNATISSEMLGLGSDGPSFLHDFLQFVEVFFVVV